MNRRLFHFIVLLFGISCSDLSGQNLVPDPSLENYIACPTALVSAGFGLPGWFCGWGTPDYFNSCASLASGVSTPQNSFGSQLPHSGNGYGGAYLVGSATSYREFLTAHLSSPLVAGREYYVSFYVSLAEVNTARNWNSIATDQIGAHFTNTLYSNNQFPYYSTLFQPQVSHPAGSYITDSSGWTKIEGSFTAAGGEAYMMLGYFIPFPLQSYVPAVTVPSPQQPAPWGYYYIDDACVMDFANPTGTTRTDTILCNGLTIEIQGRAGAHRYSWSTGDTTSEISVQEGGRFWVRSIGECQFWVDTFDVQILPPFPVLRPIDTLICTSTPTDVRLPFPLQDLLWWNPTMTSSSSHQPPINTSERGLYEYLVQWSANGCVSDLVPVRIRVEDIPSVLITDTILCVEGPMVSLGTPQNGVRYLWSTGDTSCCITTNRPGRYIVEASNDCGREVDSATVSTYNCRSCLWLPTSFTPNGDGLNDHFGAVTMCPVTTYRMSIYNRWGQCLFISYKTTDRWDGSFKGLRCESGTYFYFVEYVASLPGSITNAIRGDVTLIH